MKYEISERYILSSNGKNMLAGTVYVPSADVRGYVHVVHGMTDHISRYAPLMASLAEEGYIVFGYDHLGHGYTARDDSELGFIASHGGDELLVKDIKVFSDAIRAEYGDHPYYLIGHSMGSFIVRLAAAEYVAPEKLIIIGTGGPNPIAPIGLLLCDIIRIFKGERAYSDMLENMAFGTYNDRFSPDEGKYAWLTAIGENRDIYAADKFCTFRFTVSALHDLVKLNKRSNSAKWFKTMASRGADILLLSGDEDPVGANGNGVQRVYETLAGAGAKVQIKLYPKGRHEILNDLCADEVISDVKAFLNK